MEGPGPRALRAVLALASLVVALCVSGAPATAATSPVGLRVVGGSSVSSIAYFPFQVALFVQTPGGFFGQQGSLAFCGGVIIDPIQIVTAAHCVTNEVTGALVSPANVTLLAGTATLPPTVPAQPVATSITVDPSYDPRTADSDVAVVTLSRPLYSGSPRPDGTATVAPIALITPSLAARFANPNVTPAEPVVVSGWGETTALGVGAQDNSGNLPQQLQAVRTHLVPDATCASQYAGLGGIGVPPITSRMLCAGELGGGIDACSGDSGGPLVVDINNPIGPPGDYVLAGLIDFGAGCAQPGYPGVYVRLATPEITGFISQSARAAGQQLVPAPTPVGVSPPHTGLPNAGTARLEARSGRVRSRLTRIAVRCRSAPCTGSLKLRTTITVGVGHFSIAANTTVKVPVRITPSGLRQLNRHGHRLRTRLTLRTTGSPSSARAFTISD
ncbi:MAG: S1 family serine peptidase [Solirubrobacteraceae bacterium]